MKLRSALLASAMLAAPAIAFAQPVSGVYIAAGAGMNWFPTTNGTLTATSGANSATAGFSTGSSAGFVGLGSLGYGLGNGLRFEVEGNYRTNSFTGAKIDSYGAMFNGLYDFNAGPLMPYIGLGLGYETTKLSTINVTYPQGKASIGGSKGSLAGQAILGVAYPIASVPGLAVTAEYRFMGVFQKETAGGSATYNGSKAALSAKLNEQNNHAIMLGLRYAFGVAPAPVVPVVTPTPTPIVAPAPAPARSYLVFFDWDKADLTARAQQIIAEAAQASTRVATTRIDVAGHADKSGTPAYNQGLSLKRANNVAAELVRLGVPRTAISITAFGDTKPLVPTAAGVREPQNRRVEIVLK